MKTRQALQKGTKAYTSHRQPAWTKLHGRRKAMHSQPTTAHAPSKLSCPVAVPATALTLTAVRTPAVPPYACAAHATVVADVHALLPHTSAAVSEAVAVGPAAPKLSPPIVTVSLPLSAALAAEVVLTTGAAAQQQSMPC
jgi:hypothetical protein